jgi:ribosome assembly protein 1
MMVEQVPSPISAQADRMKRLLPVTPAADTVAAQVEAAEQVMRACDKTAQHTMAFVSKMFAEQAAVRPGADRRFIGFARVFSGTLRVGDEMLVLGPRYQVADDAEHALQGGDLPHASKAVVTSLHLMMGSDLLDVTTVPAGCICGIGGLDTHVLKYATLSASPVCRPLHFLSFQAQPIVCVAVEPRSGPVLQQPSPFPHVL